MENQTGRGVEKRSTRYNDFYPSRFVRYINLNFISYQLAVANGAVWVGRTNRTESMQRDSEVVIKRKKDREKRAARIRRVPQPLFLRGQAELSGRAAIRMADLRNTGGRNISNDPSRSPIEITDSGLFK